MADTKLNHKMQDFKRVLDLIKGSIEQVSFFNWFSNLKNRILLNGSKIVQNMIQIALKKQFFPKIYKISPIVKSLVPRSL